MPREKKRSKEERWGGEQRGRKKRWEEERKGEERKKERKNRRDRRVRGKQKKEMLGVPPLEHCSGPPGTLFSWRESWNLLIGLGI